MGFKLQNLIAPISINNRDKQILMEIARKSPDEDRIYENGVVYRGLAKLSMDQISTVLCMHPKTVQRGINQLIQDKYILKRKISKRGNHNYYLINFENPEISKSSTELHLNISKSSTELHLKSSTELPLDDFKSSTELPFRNIDLIEDYKTNNSIDSKSIDISIEKNNLFANPIGEIPPEIKELDGFDYIQTQFETFTGQLLTDKCKDDVLSLYHESSLFLDVVKYNHDLSTAWKQLESIYSDTYSQSHIKAHFPYLITVIQNKTKEKQLSSRKTKRF